MESERYARGVKRLEGMKNQSQIRNRLDGVFPDMTKYIVEFAFGDIHCRPGLDKKSRELVILSSIATLGHAPLELKSHIHMALSVGWSKDEILEALAQLVVYAGFPTSINALFVAKEVFDECDENDKRKGNE